MKGASRSEMAMELLRITIISVASFVLLLIKFVLASYAGLFSMVICDTQIINNLKINYLLKTSNILVSLQIIRSYLSGNVDNWSKYTTINHT